MSASRPWWWRVLFALLLACLTPARAAQAPAPDKRVLLLASFAYGRPGVQGFIRTYTDTLLAGGMARDHIAVEYLHLDTDNAPAQRARLRELLLERYRAAPPDLIVAIQQPASEFLLQELPALAQRATVLSASSSLDPRSAPPGYRMLLIPARPHVRRTLQQAMALFPATERILVTVGAGPADLEVKREIAAVAAELGLRARLEYTDGLSLDGMVARAAQAGPGTLILAGLINRDVEGATIPTYDIWLRIVRAARVPSFVLFSPTVGEGSLGGAVQHVERTAAMTAGLTLDILAGRRAVAPGATVLPVQPTSFYDWEQLRRWGADPGLLPADTLYVNKPVPPWRAHPGASAAALLVILLLSLLVGGLLLQQRRLRVAERRYRVLVEHAPEAIVVYDPALGRFVDANTKAERLFGASREELLRSGPARFYAEDQPDGLALEESVLRNAERGLAGEELSVQRTVRALDGRCTPCQVSVVALPSAGGSLLRGGYVDISERVRAEEELHHYRGHLEAVVEQRTADLSRALQDAQDARRARSAFLANMSHELRTPLNAIIGFSQMMAASTSMFEDERHNLRLIHGAGVQLLGMVNDILELAKLESGQVRLDPGPVAVEALLRDVLGRLRPEAQRKGLGLSYSCPPLAPHLADGPRLRQVLLNLATNAVAFTETGEVRIDVEPIDAAQDRVLLRFSVKDSGIGIAPADQSRIFEAFVQAGAEKHPPGVGLGLTIAREYLRLMDAVLELRSAPGQGSCFAFSLALATAGPDAPRTVATPAPEQPPPSAATPLSAGQLAVVPPAQREALHGALRQLDLQHARALVAALRETGPAGLADAIDAMLDRHRYRELCALLEQSPST